MQLFSQVFGTHHFINYARSNANIIREYALLLQIIQVLVMAPILLFNAGAIATCSCAHDGFKNSSVGGGIAGLT
ncbi:hypothetical protein FD723_33500 (plasmid) [Nostoc sp. C052]|uniref:hypothetical protein n=1 Tax=unclassified Nostoc TaxID=2593658 RepID=UPI0015C31A80|nr:hypothetical protein [Nostoc sp. C052]QLE45238.1 hypothetical protein FD723_33500 [Nostoc sp. C052]